MTPASPFRCSSQPTPVTNRGRPPGVRNLAVTVPLALLPMSGVAQDVLEIDDRIICSACMIEAGPPVTLALPKDSFSFTSFPSLKLARDSEGKANDAVVLNGATIAVQATVRTGAGNTTIQILRSDGTIEESFGAPRQTTSTSRQQGMDWRVLGRSNDHADVWSAHINRYRVIRYGSDGEEKTRIERISEWFRPYSRNTPGSPYNAPADPRVVGIHQDADGLLWVAIRRASSLCARQSRLHCHAAEASTAIGLMGRAPNGPCRLPVSACRTSSPRPDSEPCRHA